MTYSLSFWLQMRTNYTHWYRQLHDNSS